MSMTPSPEKGPRGLQLEFYGTLKGEPRLMRATLCPVCRNAIDGQIVSLVRQFRCPSCGEVLRGVRPATSPIARFAIVAAVFVGAFERMYSWPMGLLLLIILPYFREVVYALSSHWFGITLEPVAEGGRFPLGESADD